MNRTLCTLITLAASVCIAPFQARAQDAQVITAAATVSEAECAGAARLSSTQGRVAELATQGVVPLRQFILRTRMIYQLDMMETVAWLDHRRALLAACGQRSAHIDPTASASVSGQIQLH
jgi:hypothetical protein